MCRLGYSQVARHRFLVPTFDGSIPSTPNAYRKMEGRMSEWFKVPALKAGVIHYRGFESLSVRINIEKLNGSTRSHPNSTC